MPARRSPWIVKRPYLAAAAVVFAASVWWAVPLVGAWVAAVIATRVWPDPTEFEPETPGYHRAVAAQAYKRRLVRPFGRDVLGAGPTGTTAEETAQFGWTPATRISTWLNLGTAVTVATVSAFTVRPGWVAAANITLGYLFLQCTAAGARDAAWPTEGASFPAAMFDRERLDDAGGLRNLELAAAGSGVGAGGFVAGLLLLAAPRFDMAVPTGWTITAVTVATITGAVAWPAHRYIHAYNQPLRDHIQASQDWQLRWMSVPKLTVLPPQFISEHEQPPAQTEQPETHRIAFFSVPPGATIEDYRATTDKLPSVLTSDPTTGDHVLIAPMPQTDEQGMPVPGTRQEGTFSVSWNTVPFPPRAHLVGGLDDWSTKFVMHRAFDRALAGLKLGTPDLVRVQPLHDDMGARHTLWDTVWQLPPDLTYDKLISKADQIAEKIGAQWLRVGRRTTDSQGRPVADGHVSLVFGAPPEQVSLADPTVRTWLDALELERAFVALNLGAPLLVDSQDLSVPGHPSLTEVRFELSADVDWTQVARKTAALQEKVAVDYLRVTRRADTRDHPSPLVSVVYGARPADTKLQGDPPGYNPNETHVGEETNPLRLWLDGVDWDAWMRASKLVGTDGRSPVIRSKTVNDQGVATYRFDTVPGLAIDTIDDRIPELRSTSGMAYIEVEEDKSDGQQFLLLAARVDPLERPYVATDYLTAPKPGDPLGRTVLHEAVPGEPDIDWVVGPGADGSLLVDRFSAGDLPHLYVGGASGSGKALTLDTPIPTPSGTVPLARLAVGDEVLNADGLPTRITWVSPTWTNRLCYRITFADGTQVVADAAHEWPVDRPCRTRAPQLAEQTEATQIQRQADQAGLGPVATRLLGRDRTLVVTTAELAGPTSDGGPWRVAAAGRTETVVNVEVAGGHPTRCIEVADDRHLFLVGEGHIPTCNSVSVLWMLLQLLHNNDPSDLKMALIDPKTELRYFRDAAHVNHFLGLDTPGFAANPYGAIADLLAAMQDETYRRNTLFVEHPATPQNLSQARWMARQEIEHADAGTIPPYWPDDDQSGFPWWDHDAGAPHPFWLPWQLIVIEECSTFLTSPANKDHKEDHQRTVGHLEELARISRSAGVHLVLVTQYPKKESFGGSTTTLAQCRRIGMKMNRVGSMLTIEEAGLEKITTPGRGMMSWNKGYRGMRCLYVRVPDEKNPDIPNDRDLIFAGVSRHSGGFVAAVPSASGAAPSAGSEPPPSPAGLWGAPAGTLPARREGEGRGTLGSSSDLPAEPADHVQHSPPGWDIDTDDIPDLDDLLANLD